MGTLLHLIEESERVKTEIKYVEGYKNSRENEILESADIIFTTLSSSGLSILDTLEYNHREYI